jgi:hypothetical protein
VPLGQGQAHYLPNTGISPWSVTGPGRTGLTPHKSMGCVMDLDASWALFSSLPPDRAWRRAAAPPPPAAAPVADLALRVPPTRLPAPGRTGVHPPPGPISPDTFRYPCSLNSL